MSLTPDELIPPGDDLAHLLEQLSDEGDSVVWKIANIANDLIVELARVATKDEVYNAVAARTKGKKKDTIRRWAECAADFSKELQEKYAGLLSFDHFKIARRLVAENKAPSVDFVLEWAITHYSARFATCNELLANFLEDEQGRHPAFRFWKRAREKAYELAESWPDYLEKSSLVDALGEIDKIWVLREQE